MTITVDTGNISSKGNVANASSPQTWAHTTGANVDMIVVIVTIFDTSASDGVVSGVTFDGKALASSFVEYDAVCDGHISVWFRANSDIANISGGTVSVSFGGTVTDFEASAVGVEGTVGSFGEDSVGTKATGNGSPSVTWAVTDVNTILFDASISDQKDPKLSADGTQVEIHNTDLVADHALASYDIQSGSGSKTMSWTDTDGDEDWVSNGVAFYEIVGATEYQQSTAGVLTPAGTIVKSSGKIVAGITTLTGSISKATTKTFTGSSTLTGILIKQAQKIFTGSSTFVGSLVNSFQKMLSITGSLTPSGTIVKQAGKVFIGSITTTGSLIKSTVKAFTGSTTLSGVLATTKVTLLSISGSITTSGILVRQTAKTFIGSVTAAGSLIAQKVGVGGEQFYKAVGGVVAMAGTLTRQTGKQITGIITTAGALFRHFLGLPTPTRQIYAIASENRIYAITSENRIYSIPRGVRP